MSLTPQEKLIRFMELKRDCTIPEYFTKEDADDIRGWGPHLSQDIWIDICEYVSPDKPLFLGGTCPFCVKSELTGGVICEDCGYGKRHGICDDSDSDFREARRRIQGSTQPIFDFVEANR